MRPLADQALADTVASQFTAPQKREIPRMPSDRYVEFDKVEKSYDGHHAVVESHGESLTLLKSQVSQS